MNRTFRLRLRARIAVWMVAIILGVVAFSLSVVSWRVGRQVRETLESDLQKTIEVFQASQRDRSAALRTINRILADEPKMKALISHKDPATVLDEAHTFHDLAESDRFILLYPDGTIAADVHRPEAAGEDLSGWPVVQEAFTSESGVAESLLAEASQLLLAVATRISAGEEPLGALLTGFDIDDSLAARLQRVTKSHVAFVLDGKISAGSLAHEEELRQLDLAVQLEELKQSLRDQEAVLLAATPEYERDLSNVQSAIARLEASPGEANSPRLEELRRGRDSMMAQFEAAREDLDERREQIRELEQAMQAGLDAAALPAVLERRRAELSQQLARADGISTFAIAGETFMGILSPMEGFPRARYLILKSLDRAMGFSDALRRTLVLIGLIALAAAAAVSAFISAGITRPVRELLQGTQIVAAGDLQHSIQSKAGDEIGDLAFSFNVMTGKLKESFTQLQRQNQELRTLDRLKSEFLANTSHELRTPLNGILGLVESVIDRAYGDVDPPQAKILGMVLNSGRRLRGLIDNILTFSATQQGKLTLALQKVQPAVLVEELRPLFEGLKQAKPLDLVFHVENDLPVIDADPEKIRQMMINLVGNAIKFTERGTVRMSWESIRDSHGEVSHVRLAVSDTGFGIDPKDQALIFEPFRQADASATRKYGGTGLGLAITKEIVMLHGGTISVESRPGHGSTFSALLPISVEKLDAVPSARHREGMPAPEPLQQPAPAAAESPPQTPVEFPAASQEAIRTPAGGLVGTEPIASVELRRGKGEEIWVIDDEEINCEVIKGRLELYNYRTEKFLSAPDALRALDGGQMPELVILDIMMPMMSGYDFCREIQKRGIHNDLPVIMLSAKNQPLDKIYGLSLGAVDYLTKPFEKEELLAKVRTYLDVRAYRELLKEINRELEAKVEERTTQLRQANEQLAASLEDLKRSEVALVQSEKMAGLGVMVAGVAHEINNPLNFIFSNLPHLDRYVKAMSEAVRSKEPSDLVPKPASAEGTQKPSRTSKLERAMDDSGKLLRSMSEGVTRIKEIVDRLRRFARTDQLGEEQPQQTDIRALLQDAIAMTASLHSNRIRVHEEYDDTLPSINGFPGRLAQVFVNLTTNACQAIQETGEIWVRAAFRDSRVIVSVRDSGIGIEQKHLARVFEPFFTTKPVGQGVGLGLSIVYSIVQQHGGTIAVESTPGEGATFTVELPVEGSPTRAAAPRSTAGGMV